MKDKRLACASAKFIKREKETILIIIIVVRLCNPCRITLVKKTLFSYMFKSEKISISTKFALTSKGSTWMLSCRHKSMGVFILRMALFLNWHHSFKIIKSFVLFLQYLKMKINASSLCSSFSFKDAYWLRFFFVTFANLPNVLK